MTITRRFLAISTIALLPLLAAPPVAAQDDDALGADDNAAVAVNTADGSSVFRLAFSVRRVAGGTAIDQTNTAIAYASCQDCQTVALAFQVILVQGSAGDIVPENTAIAYNEQCASCLTYASATQLVIGTGGLTKLTAEGKQRLRVLEDSLRALEDRSAELTPSELLAEVNRAKLELLAIYTEELEAIGEGKPAEELQTSTATDDFGEGEPGSTEPLPETDDPVASTTTTTTAPTATDTGETTTTSSTTAPDQVTTTTTVAP